MGDDMSISDDIRVLELERELEHATAVAACSIGQDDRMANIAYREEVRARLNEARRKLA